jgi:hypothetical protein
MVPLRQNRAATLAPGRWAGHKAVPFDAGAVMSVAIVGIIGGSGVYDLPGLKVTKSEMTAPCSICGVAQFKAASFVGCTCLKALAKSVKSEAKPDGAVLTFGKGWDDEDIEALRNLLRGDQ